MDNTNKYRFTLEEFEKFPEIIPSVCKKREEQWKQAKFNFPLLATFRLQRALKHQYVRVLEAYEISPELGDIVSKSPPAFYNSFL